MSFQVVMWCAMIDLVVLVRLELLASAWCLRLAGLGEAAGAGEAGSRLTGKGLRWERTGDTRTRPFGSSPCCRRLRRPKRGVERQVDLETRFSQVVLVRLIRFHVLFPYLCENRETWR